MGVSIYWQPLRGTYLQVGARSRFVSIMERVFGSYPWTITAGHASKLRDIAIGVEDEGIKEALHTLADAAEKHEQISVWPEY
jgi:hypothetical protein